MPHSGIKRGDPAGPNVFVIFGATGDLTKRKLIPALYNLCRDKLLPKEFAIVGIARREATHDDIRKRLSEEIREYATGDFDDSTWKWLCERIYAHTGTFDDPTTYVGPCPRSSSRSTRSAARAGTTCSTSPRPRASLARSPRLLGEVGLAQETEDAWRRVIVEKPFGHDLESARARSTASSGRCCRRIRSIGSTTTSGKRRCRTSC